MKDEQTVTNEPREWGDRNTLLVLDQPFQTSENCRALSDRIRGSLLEETPLASAAAAEVLATMAADLLVALQLQTERQELSDGISGDAARALPALASNAKRILDTLGVTGPMLEDPEDEL